MKKRRASKINVYMNIGSFDAVIVSNADSRNYSKEEDRRLLYTVCTRALHELHLYYSNDLTYFIKDMDKGLYLAGK